jgi:hypothetical protein
MTDDLHLQPARIFSNGEKVFEDMIGPCGSAHLEPVTRRILRFALHRSGLTEAGSVSVTDVDTAKVFDLGESGMDFTTLTAAQLQALYGISELPKLSRFVVEGLRQGDTLEIYYQGL